MSSKTPESAGLCSQCGGPRTDQKTNPTFPFCSQRCKLIDLARWLEGDYRIPVGAGVTERTVPGADELAIAQARDEMS